MSNIYVTFSGDRYHESTKRIVEDAPKFGADAVHVYDNLWLERCRPGYWDRMSWFREQRHRKESGPRGIDWFTWKALVILDALGRVEPGDVVLYTDGDCYPIGDLRPLFQRCRDDRGVMLFEAIGCPQRVWTKRDCYIAMGCDREEYHSARHTVARFLLFQKDALFPAEQFVGEWLGFTANPIINTFKPSVLGKPELPGFVQHRCEQSVLSNLRVKYGCKLYREACQFGDGQPQDQEIYPTVFHQEGRHSYSPDGYVGGSVFANVRD